MKKIFLSSVALMFVSALLAQRQPPPTYSGGPDDGDVGGGGFKKENIFIGGSIGLGFSGNTFNVGANPEIGYSFSRWLDAGIALNLNYYSQAASTDPNPYDYDYDNDTRTRELDYGAGVFARIYPLNFLFIQLQPEQNWIHLSQTYFNYGGGSTSASATVNAFSFIAGVGYTRRIVGQASSYIMVGLDLANNQYSPYRQNGVAIPIVRAGFDFYLKPSRKSGHRSN